MRGRPSIKVIASDIGGVHYLFSHKKTAYAKELGVILGVEPSVAIAAEKKHLRAYNLGQLTERQYFDRILRTAKSSASFTQFSRFTREQFFTRVNAGFVRLLRSLREKTLIVLVANQPTTLDLVHRSTHIYDAFDIVMSSHKTKLLKPDPRVFDLLVERTGALPAEIVFIDDTSRNVEAAKEYGLRAFRYTSLSQLRRDLRSCGVLPVRTKNLK